MLTGELYADFSLLWLVCHQSRVESLQKPGASADCWLERWSQAAAEQGTRALDALRQGVQEAISALGRGFLRHPANRRCESRLQVRRAEHARLLPPTAAPGLPADLPVRGRGSRPAAAARRRRPARATLPRLLQSWAVCAAWPRRAAAARTPTCTATLRLVCGQLRAGYAALGLPALGGFLFSPAATPNLDAADLANHDLLERDPRAGLHRGTAGCAGPWTTRNLDSEELGSVYEIAAGAAPPAQHRRRRLSRWRRPRARSARPRAATTRPGPLISTLLDSALEPVDRGAAWRANAPAAEQEQALLSIKVVDPPRVPAIS